MVAIWNAIKNNIVQWLALLLGIINLVLLLKDKLKEKIKLDVIVNSAYNFEFLTDKKYQYILCSIRIVNKSKTETDVIGIELEDSDGNCFSADYFGHHTDPLNKSAELCFYSKDMHDKINFPVDSQNIMNNSRVKSYGVIYGFALFKGVPPLKAETDNYTLKISSPKKVFKKVISVSKYSDNYASFSEVNRMLRLKR